MGPSPTVYDCILANANFWPAANATYAQMQASCETAIAELAAQKIKCDEGQSGFEEASCSVAQEIASTCASMDMCHTAGVAAYEKTKETVKVSEAARHKDYEAASQVMCFIDVFKLTEGKEAKFEECKDKVYKIPESMEIEYHPVPAEE